MEGREGGAERCIVAGFLFFLFCFLFFQRHKVGVGITFGWLVSFRHTHSSLLRLCLFSLCLLSPSLPSFLLFVPNRAHTTLSLTSNQGHKRHRLSPPQKANRQHQSQHKNKRGHKCININALYQASKNVCDKACIPSLRPSITLSDVTMCLLETQQNCPLLPVQPPTSRSPALSFSHHTRT